MSYRRVFMGKFLGDRDQDAEIKYFKETVVPIMAARGATSVEIIQTENDLFLATAIYPDEATADANPEEIQALRKGIIEAFNLNAMDAYGGTSVVGI